jgi:hypothetical protein
MDRNQFLSLIGSNIDKYGYHVTIVNSTLEPRYAYTIGLTKLLGFELIFAGGIYYMKDQLFVIIDTIVEELKSGKKTNETIRVSNLGNFTLNEVLMSWSQLTMLGVFDYYKLDQISAMQIKPDSNHYTADIPNMSKEFHVSSNPIWQWLEREWSYSVPSNSTVITNIASFCGKPITEVMRWEENEWEMFAGAGPDVDERDKRVVSLATIIGLDSSLKCVVDLEIGKGVWRDAVDLIWHKWG